MLSKCLFFFSFRGAVQKAEVSVRTVFSGMSLLLKTDRTSTRSYFPESQQMADGWRHMATASRSSMIQCPRLSVDREEKIWSCRSDRSCGGKTDLNNMEFLSVPSNKTYNTPY